MRTDGPVYLMGLGPPNAVQPILVFDNSKQLSIRDGRITFSAGGSHAVSINEIIKKFGPRTPAWPNTQRHFRAITVILTSKELSPIELEPFRDSIHWYSCDHPLVAADPSYHNFNAMTRGLASIRMNGLSEASQPTKP